MSIRSRLLDLARRTAQVVLAKAQAQLEQPAAAVPIALLAPAQVVPPSSAAPKGETFGEYATRWLKSREDGGMASAIDYESNLRTHILPILGDKVLSEVTVSDIRSLVASLRSKESARSRPDKPKKLAPNTVRGVYAMTKNIFGCAVADDLIVKTPCRLKKTELPKKAYAKEDFKERAIYSRDEMLVVLNLENAPRVRFPDYWQQLYRAVFFTGGRIGEVCALTFEKVDLESQPLGKVTIARSYSSKRKKVGTTKTGDVRVVPIHKAWAPHFRRWIEHGYRAHTGRDPEPGAIVFPAKGRGLKRGQLVHRSNTVCRHRVADDLARLGLRDRHIHVFRRTFVTIACNTDGADTKILRSLTHARSSADVHDGYRNISFEDTCRELSKMDFETPIKTEPVPMDNGEKKEDEGNSCSDDQKPESP